MQLVETDPDTVGSVGLLEDKCSLALTQMLRTFFVTLLYILVIIIFFLGHLLLMFASFSSLKRPVYLCI